MNANFKKWQHKQQQGSATSPDMSPPDPCPCWGPTPWRWGSLWSIGSVHCGWTWRPTRRKWSLRRRICCPDLQVLQILTDDRRKLDYLYQLHSHRISRRCSRLVCLSQSAEALMSQRRSVPLLLLYTNRWQWWGWNSADVITSVRSSMLAGLMSTISEKKLRIETSKVERSQKNIWGIFLFWFQDHPQSKGSQTDPDLEVHASAAFPVLFAAVLCGSAEHVVLSE